MKRNMVEVEQLRKSYGSQEALGGVSFRIGAGEVVGLLGPNGAGKTTAMKILAGYLLPTAGSARVAGIDVTADPRGVQRRIGYLPENAPSYPEMVVQDYLRFLASMHGLDRNAFRGRLGDTVDACGIGEVLTRTVGTLSKGFRQRVGLAAAILHDPPILVLDEPTTGLDPNQIVEVRDWVRGLGAEKTVILSTHILPEVEATCDRALILIGGRIRADAALIELKSSNVWRVTATAPEPGRARERLAGLDGVSAVSETTAEGGRRTWRVEAGAGGEIGERIADLARQDGWRLRELRRDERSLEQVFRELTTASGAP